jgi:hypothetical protein
MESAITWENFPASLTWRVHPTIPTLVQRGLFQDQQQAL